MKPVLLKQLACLCGAILSSAAAQAQHQPKIIEDVLVIAHPLSGESLSQASDVLSGDELERKLAANIGATLAKQAGIHSASFGAAVGRPVIHGLSGPRIKIMEDRIDTLDVSVTSADHAVSIEPFIAERIEVLKGASSLLYGSGAIGGVVDIHTARIPHAIPDGGISGGIETRHADNANSEATSAKLNGGLGNFAWHLDATIKDANDYDIPGFAESSQLRATEDHDESEEHPDETLAGSFFSNRSAAVGTSYLADWGFVGFAFSKLKAEYGLPGGHEHHEEHEEDEEHEEHDEHVEGTPRLDLEQSRSDFELGISEPYGNISKINIRLGINDYSHREIESDGEVASTFSNKAWESRTEFVLDGDIWTSVFGVQLAEKTLSVIGEEAFIPKVRSSDRAAFYLAERDINGVDFETGIRLGQVTHKPQDDRQKQFTDYSLSIGAVAPLSDSWQLNLLADLSSRAPVAEELYANGPHLVTGSFERGDSELDSEQALNISAILQFTGERVSATTTLYHTQFSDFIYQQRSDEISDDLPVVAYTQSNADFYGLDIEFSIELLDGASASSQLRGIIDYVDAELDIDGNNTLPRMPPMRYGLGWDLQWGKLSSSIDYLRVQRPKQLSLLELDTNAYNDLSANIKFELHASQRATVSVFLQAKNLNNEEQRAHTSFIKEVAPAPGRSIEGGLRVVF